MNDSYFGGIELGGTHIMCAVSDSAGNIMYQMEIPTTTPEESLKLVTDFFMGCPKSLAIGVGSFGPVDLNPASETYGFITNTPKPGWKNIDIKGLLESRLGTKVLIQTDVNCAAVGEYYYGVAKGHKNFLYMSVGTGIGASQMIDGKLVQSQAHSELGHMMIPHDTMLDPFGGTCPYHGNCFEGLASGGAIEKRVNQNAQNVIDYRRWDLEALYLALGIHNLITLASPDLIVLGGGVIKHGGLVEQVTRRVKTLMNGYMKIPEIIVATENNDIKGAVELAAAEHNQAAGKLDNTVLGR